MSADVWIVRDRCKACGRGGDVDESLNITYNLTGMLREAGFHGWQWCIGKTAREVGTHMLAVLDGMNTDPEKWRAMNPPNGWGDYDQCLQGRMRAWAEVAAASNNSGDQIGGWL